MNPKNLGRQPDLPNCRCYALTAFVLLVSLIFSGCFTGSAIAKTANSTAKTTNSAIDKNIKRLEKIGFTKVGQWRLNQGKLDFSLEGYANKTTKNVLYAFVAHNTIEYIGKTTKTLAKRMKGYRKPGPTQSTNKRNHKNIRALLEKNIPVAIFALPDRGLLKYGEFSINMAAGLEDSLIKQIAPCWNK